MSSVTIVIKASSINPPVDFDRPLLCIDQLLDSYRISRFNVPSAPDLLVSVSDLPAWGRHVYYWDFLGKGFVLAKNYDESRDYDSFMRSRFGCPEGPVLVVARGGANELAIVSLVPTRTDLPYTAPGYGGVLHAIDAVIPGYINSPLAKTVLAKIDLLESVSPIDMLAEQEKQIDLLSMLVIDLAEQRPVSERPAWLSSFKAMVEQHNSLQFKGAPNCISDVTDRKSAMRALQAEYFLRRDN